MSIIDKTKDIIAKKPIIREIFLYGVIGATAASLDAMGFIFFRWIGVGLLLSNFISINLGITLSFFLNTFFNFKKTDELRKRAFKFFAVGYVGLLISMIIMYIFVDRLQFPEVVIKLSSIIFVAAVQFVLNKFFTYKDKK